VDISDNMNMILQYSLKKFCPEEKEMHSYVGLLCNHRFVVETPVPAG
jgi:hypothetical protein